jgi:hypothetical protein
MRNITKFDAEVITDLHPLFRSLLWVATARSKDDERHILQHVHIERDALNYYIVATDGKRMHVGTFDPGMFDTDISAIEPGEYEVVSKAAKKIVLAAADDAGTYPKWKSLLPDGLPVARDIVTRASISRLGIRSGVVLATDFVLEACGFGCGFGKDESVSVEFASESPGGPFLISHELGKAIVMPLRMDDDSATTEEEATAEIPGVPAPKKPAAPAPVDHEPDLLDGPRIVDVEEEETREEISDYDVTQMLVDLEKTNKLQRRKKLDLLLNDHGPDLICKLVSYNEWNEPDKHLAKLIKEKANALAAPVDHGRMMEESKAAAMVVIGKSQRDKKYAAIDKIGLDWGLPGLRIIEQVGGKKIAPVFKHHLDNLIFDMESAEADSQPEGDSDY